MWVEDEGVFGTFVAFALQDVGVRVTAGDSKAAPVCGGYQLVGCLASGYLGS